MTKKCKKILTIILPFIFILSGCKAAGDEATENNAGNDMSVEGDSGNETEEKIKLTEDEMNKAYAEIKISDCVSVSGYITPYSAYKDGIKIYEALYSDVEYTDKIEDIKEIMEKQSDTKLTIGEQVENRLTLAGKNGQGSIFKERISYCDNDDRAELIYWGFSLTHKSSSCQGINTESVKDFERISELADACNFEVFEVADLYDYDTMTAQADVYSDYIMSEKAGELSVELSDNGYEFYVLSQKKDNIAIKYQGILYKNSGYENYNEELFKYTSALGEQRIASNCDNSIELGYNNGVLSYVSISNMCRTGGILKTEQVIDINDVIGILQKQFLTATENVKITSIELCYDVKLYINDNMLDGKLYPYWIINYYDTALEYKEDKLNSETPAGKIIIDAVTGSVTDKNRSSLDKE